MWRPRHQEQDSDGMGYRWDNLGIWVSGVDLIPSDIGAKWAAMWPERCKMQTKEGLEELVDLVLEEDANRQLLNDTQKAEVKGMVVDRIMKKGLENNEHEFVRGFTYATADGMYPMGDADDKVNQDDDQDDDGDGGEAKS